MFTQTCVTDGDVGCWCWWDEWMNRQQPLIAALELPTLSPFPSHLRPSACLRHAVCTVLAISDNTVSSCDVRPVRPSSVCLSVWRILVGCRYLFLGTENLVAIWSKKYQKSLKLPKFVSLHSCPKNRRDPKNRAGVPNTWTASCRLWRRYSWWTLLHVLCWVDVCVGMH